MAFEEPRERPRGRPKKGAPKRPISRVFHMAWAGTVTFHDHEGGVLAELLASDALALRERCPELLISILGDGAHELWHLVQKLAAAARLIAPEDSEALLAAWKLALLNRDGAPSTPAQRAIRRSRRHGAPEAAGRQTRCVINIAATPNTSVQRLASAKRSSLEGEPSAATSLLT